MKDSHINAAFVAIFAALVLLMFWLAHEDGLRWSKFRDEHGCRKVSEASPSTINAVAIGSDGRLSTGIGVVPGMDGWLCDDGVTYYR